MVTTAGISNCMQKDQLFWQVWHSFICTKRVGLFPATHVQNSHYIWISHAHIRGNKRTIVHTLANLRDLAELLFQPCQIVSQGTWCKCFKTCPYFGVSKGGLVVEEGILLLWWGKHLSLEPPQCVCICFAYSDHAMVPIGPKLCVFKGLGYEQALPLKVPAKQEIEKTRRN